MTKRIVQSLAVLVLAQSGCHQVQDIFIPGMDYSPEKVPAYDAVVGDFSYTEEQGEESILFYGPESQTPLDATSALQLLDLEQYLDEVLSYDISKVCVYARWDNEQSQYNVNAAWLALNCEDFYALGSAILTEDFGNFSDSHSHLACLYYDSYRTSCLHEEVYFECEGY